TGTATGGSAGSGSTFGTLTDSGQAWTTNNLRGRFVSITGGTGNGQFFVIDSNTATQLTIVGTWTAPTGTSTYAIQDSSVTINTSCTSTGTGIAASTPNLATIFIIDNSENLGAGAIAFRNMNIAAPARAFFISDSSRITLTQMQVNTASTTV